MAATSASSPKASAVPTAKTATAPTTDATPAIEGPPCSHSARVPSHTIKAERGVGEAETLNVWTRPAEHKGIVSCWREPQSGVLLEVQFHTRPSYEAWQLTHPAYERLRDPRTSDAERADLKIFIRKVYGVFSPEPANQPGEPAGDTPGKVTYYAIVDSLSSRAEPAGVLRRIEHEAGNATRRSVMTWRGGIRSCSIPPSAATSTTTCTKSARLRLTGLRRGSGGQRLRNRCNRSAVSSRRAAQVETTRAPLPSPAWLFEETASEVSRRWVRTALRR
jgi:hypothetical protein